MKAGVLNHPEVREDAVAKKKSPRANRTKKSLFVEIAPPLRAALDAAAKEERRGLGVIVSMALEKHLESLGFWPWPAKKDDEK